MKPGSTSYHNTDLPPALAECLVEIDGKKAFDWSKALSIASALDDDVTLGTLTTLAESWVTCACGSLCRKLPRLVDWEDDVQFYGRNCASVMSRSSGPADSLLRGLGRQFAADVSERMWDAATATLNLIEKRTAQLLSEQEKSDARI